MSDPSVDQSISEKCAVDPDHNSPNSPPTDELNGSEKDENEMSHSELVTGDSENPRTKQNNLTGMDDGITAEDYTKESDSENIAPPDSIGTASMEDPDATPSNVDKSAHNDNVPCMESSNVSPTPALPLAEEGALDSISSAAYEKDVHTEGQSPNLSSRIGESGQILDDTFENAGDQDAEYDEVKLAEGTFQADGMYPVSPDTDRPVVDDSQPTDISPALKESDASLMGESEPSKLSEQKEVTDSASTGEVTLDRSEVPENDDLHPVSSDTDRSVVDDSQPADISPTLKESDASLIGESEPSKVGEPKEVADSASTGESTVSSGEVPENEDLPYVQGLKVSPLNLSNADEDLTESSMLQDEEHTEECSPVSVATSEQTANAPGLEEEMAEKPQEAVNTPDVADHELVAELSENGFDESLADGKYPITFPGVTAATAEEIGRQEAMQDTELKDADQLTVNNESPVTMSSKEITDGASPENDLLTSDGDILNAKSFPETLDTAGETSNILKLPGQISHETSNRLSDSTEGDSSELPGEKSDEIRLTDAEEDGNTSGVNVTKATPPEGSSSFSDSEPSVENAQHEKVKESPPYHQIIETESLTQPERAEGTVEYEDQVQVTEAHLPKSASEMKTTPDGLGEEQVGNEASFNTAPTQVYSQSQQRPPSESDSLLEHFATEHHVAGYLESETEFQALSADTENATKLSDSQASLFQVSANTVAASALPQVQPGSSSDQSTTEKPESTKQSDHKPAEVFSEVPPTSASVSEDHFIESTNYLNYSQPKQAEMSTFADTFPSEGGKSDESGVKSVPDGKSLQETKQRSRTLDPKSMSTWSDIHFDPRKRAATLGRSGSSRRPKLMPKPSVNDDHLFPDSVTPSKVDRELSVRSLSVGLPEGTYDVPYIDDDAFLPRKLRDPNNQTDNASGSEYSSEGGDWNWPNSGVQNEMWNHAHIADVNECIPTPQLTPQQQRVPSKGKRANGKEYIDGKKPKTSRKRRLFNLCNCVGRQSRA